MWIYLATFRIQTQLLHVDFLMKKKNEKKYRIFFACDKYLEFVFLKLS